MIANNLHHLTHIHPAQEKFERLYARKVFYVQ